MRDHEGHDTRSPVVRGIRDQRQASGLPGVTRSWYRIPDNSKVVPMEWIGVVVVGICCTGNDQFFGKTGDRVFAVCL